MALDETYRSAAITVTRAISIISVIANVTFYIVLVCRWRLTEKLHWYVCNFVISELIRSVATILKSVLEEAMLPLLNVQPPPGQTLSDITKDMMTSLNTRTVLDGIQEVGYFVSMIFALITFFYFYRKFRTPYAAELFSKQCLIASAVVWTTGVVLLAALSVLRIRTDTFEAIFLIDNIITIVFATVFGFADVILFGFVARLLCCASSSSVANDNGDNNYLINLQREKSNKKICTLLALLSALMISAAMLIFLAAEEIYSPFDDGPLGEARTIVEDLVGLWMNLLAICWPFVWIWFDARLNQECEKFYICTKKPFAKVGNVSRKLFKIEIAKRQFNANHIETFRKGVK